MRTERRRQLTGLAFCLPWLIGLAVFMVYPMASALVYSFCDYSVLLPPVGVGLDNYADLLADALFWKSLGNTVYYAAGAVGLGLLTSLVLALLLNCRVRGQALYRTIFFLPSLVPIVAASILWMWMYKGQGGIINTVLESLGIDGPAWLGNPAYAKPALILMAVWASGHAMVIFLAGLQDVPVQLHEAAYVDGATWWHRLVHITLPMITPVIYFNLIMGIIASLQVFTQAFIMTGGAPGAGAPGGPERSLLFYVLRLHNVAFQDLRMGYACAMAWILFVIILALTLLMHRLSKRWVTYER